MPGMNQTKLLRIASMPMTRNSGGKCAFINFTFLFVLLIGDLIGYLTNCTTRYLNLENTAVHNANLESVCGNKFKSVYVQAPHKHRTVWLKTNGYAAVYVTRG